MRSIALFFLAIHVYQHVRCFKYLNRFASTQIHRGKDTSRDNFFPPISSDADDTSSNKDASFYDSSDVDAILENIMKSMAPMAANADTSVRDDLSEDDLNQKFAKLLAEVKSDSTVSEDGKKAILDEAKSLMEDSKSGNSVDGNQIPTVISKVPVYSSSAKIVLVYGKGRVSKKLLEIVDILGKAAQIKLLEAEYLSVIQDSELKFVMKDASAIIIAADSGVVEKKNFFGQATSEDLPNPLSFKGLKRLLNAAVEELNRSQRDTRIKVVALGKASKPPKSAMSFMAGDTTELESEVILECKQRKLPYNIIKVGRIIGDDERLPDNIRIRSIADSSIPVIEEDAAIAKPLYRNPIIFSNSKIIEYSECTRISVASEALLRSVGHPHRNATVTVLSSTENPGIPSEADWEDEFLKIDGPELQRFPIRFATARKAATVLRRVATALEEPGSGLVTAIEVEKLSNGVRIIFRPSSSSYVSSKEEKELLLKKQKEEEEKEKEKRKVIRKSGYLSPEEEKKEEQRLKIASGEAVPTAAPKKKMKPEGGLEVVVDKDPYLRVRVRRCNMGPETIIKEESELLIMRAITSSLRALDNDYKILMKQPLGVFSDN